MSVSDRDRLVVDLNADKPAKINHLICQTRDVTNWYRLGGCIMFAPTGLGYVQKLNDMGKKVFVDVHLYDVPETIRGSIRNLKMANVRAISVFGGIEIMKTAVGEKTDTTMIIMAPFVAKSELNETVVQRRFELGMLAGCDGFVIPESILSAYRSVIPDLSDYKIFVDQVTDYSTVLKETPYRVILNPIQTSVLSASDSNVS